MAYLYNDGTLVWWHTCMMMPLFLYSTWRQRLK